MEFLGKKPQPYWSLYIVLYDKENSCNIVLRKVCINTTIFKHEQLSCLKALMETPYFAETILKLVALHKIAYIFGGIVAAKLMCSMFILPIHHKSKHSLDKKQHKRKFDKH